MIYRFAVDVDQVGLEQFDDAAVDFRSDSEQRHTSLALHDPESPEVRLVRQEADEIINISGAEVDVFIRTDNADYDAVWDEDADPTYWDKVPMKAFFKPTPLEAELKKWGAESINKAEIVFSHRQLFLEFGERMLRSGDVIKIQYNSANPSLNPQHYRVLNGTPSGNFRYVWLYYTCQCETLTADITVRPPGDIMPDEEFVKTNGQYRESL